ncbi:MAG: hypothetical protein EZS28_015684 [Streblomastix strix]|uniref:Uncharacterized protein n=1 Tax=Streblomastix strix TaxID=222440 RepID=A0A5J4W1L5_9EUKA|nr:MAG: hypothetical protein EZS28_015684 [Streblomastix strix]
MYKSQALRKLKENGTTFESFTGGYLMQIGKQIKVFEDGQKAPKVLTQAQQNKLLQIPVSEAGFAKQVQPIMKQQDERLMFQDDIEEESEEEIEEGSPFTSVQSIEYHIWVSQAIGVP